jgi:Na+-driven multidrug efflux pump
MEKYIWIIGIIIYIALTHVIARYIGEKRKIGYTKSVFYSLSFSPILGFIITRMSSLTAK